MRPAIDGSYSSPVQTPAALRPAASTQPAVHPAPASGGSAASGGSQSTPSWTPPGDTIDLSQYRDRPQLLHIIQQQMQQDATSGTFNDGSPGESTNDARMTSVLGNAYGSAIGDRSVNGRQMPPNYVAQQDAEYYLGRYMQGKLQGQDPHQTQPQRLQNVMAGLGPAGSYAYLSRLSPDQMKQYGVQPAFAQLVKSGSLTPDDAQQLVQGQRRYAVDDNTNGSAFDSGNVESAIAGMKSNDPNTLAFKNAFAQASLDAGSDIQQGLQNGSLRGPYDGQTRREAQLMYSQARDVLTSTSGNDDAKRAAFEQMAGDARTSGSSNDSRDKAFANSIAAYAAQTLSTASPGAVSAELRSIGGLSADGSKDATGFGPHGYVDPNSRLGGFLTQSLAGESAFASGAATDPLYDNPSGTSGLLEKLAKGGDDKLTAGMLAAVTDNFAQNPGQAQQLTSSGTLQKAITDALGSSFDRFANIGESPGASLDAQRRLSGNATSSDGEPGVTSSAAQRFQILSAIESGSPYSKNQTLNFENVLGNHATALSDYAQSKNLTASQSNDVRALLGQSPSRQLAAQSAYAISQAFMNGYAAQHVKEIAQAGAAKPADTVGNVLDTLSKVDGYAQMIPDIAPVAAPVGSVLSVAGDLHDAGFLKPADDSASKAALAKLGTDDTLSGGANAFLNMAGLYNDLADSSANQQSQAAANANVEQSTASGLLVNGSYFSDTQSFFSAYDPPLDGGG